MAKPKTQLVNMSASQVFNLITKGTITAARAGVLTVNMTTRNKTTIYYVPINGAVVDQVIEDDVEAAPAKRRGRPKKAAATKAAPAKRRRGRPPKKVADEAAPKKRRGRPPKGTKKSKKTKKSLLSLKL